MGGEAVTLALERNKPTGPIALSKSVNLSFLICELGLMISLKVILKMKLGNVYDMPRT